MLEGRAGRVLTAAAQLGLAMLLLVGAGCKAEPSADARLARLERRVDKLVAALEQALPPAEPDPAAVYAVPISVDDPVDGPTDARLTLVEGFELACPYCFAAQEVLATLRARHPADLRIVSKYFLVHGQAAVPAGLAVCAANKQGQFQAMKRALWRKLFPAGAGQAATARPELAAEQLTLEAVLTTAAEVGLDLQRLTLDMQGEACQRWVRAGEAELAPLGARGTPAFYLNGRALLALDADSIAPLLEEELEKARRVIARGVPPADYYRTAVTELGLRKVASRFAD